MAEDARKTQDRSVGIAVLLIGAVLLYETFFFHKVDWVPLGMAFWPRILLGCLAVLAVYFIVRGSLDEGPYGELALLAFLILTGCVGYGLLIETAGWLVLTPAFLFVFTWFLSDRSKRGVIHAALSACVGTFFVYVLFHYGLDVQFPEGLLETDL